MCFRKTGFKVVRGGTVFFYIKVCCIEYFIYLCQSQIRKNMKQLCQNKHTIRFRYWSRKKYAMFYSLGKYVTIGNLKKEIADVSLGKQANVCTAFSVCSSARKEDAGNNTSFCAECQAERKRTPSDFPHLVCRLFKTNSKKLHFYPVQ